MTRREGIRKVDLLLSAELWDRVAPLARRRQFAMLFRQELAATLLHPESFEGVALWNAKSPPEVHRISVEVTTDDLASADAIVASNPKAFPRGRMSLLLLVVRRLAEGD
jgi:hypothetical protein